MHENHRKRVRQRFRQAGLESFPAHNVLEMLLFYAIPRQDTNEIAHRLIRHFGTLSAVLDAPFEELCKVQGIGENSATLIMFVAQIAKRYLAEQVQEKISFANKQALHRFAVSLFTGMKSEAAFLLCFDNTTQLLHAGQISLGTKHAVSLDNRTLLESAFRHNATKVVLVHNHPNGLAAPSRSDVVRTEGAVKIFNSVQIQLLDHLIVAQGQCFSMAAHPKHMRIFHDEAPSILLQIAADEK
ncbi:MAG: DNA repair protein RadC [Oscillospiraceae bacterium]|nr:DNA repair protein RadC [Oscillospiraceae bacterium]